MLLLAVIFAGLSGHNISIIRQPEDQVIKPGEHAKFFIDVKGRPVKFQWYLNDVLISTAEKNYQGIDTATLHISKCFSKHRGNYHCVLTTAWETQIRSSSAMLRLGTVYKCICNLI